MININHMVEWIVPDFDKLLSDKKIKVYRTKNTSDTNYTRFQFKVQFLGRDRQTIEIYCKSHNRVVLKSLLKMSFFDYCKRSRPIVKIKNTHALQANKWQYLGSIDQVSKLSDELKLQFHYNVIDNFDISKSKLSNDFEYLLNTALFSDITMKSAEGNEYKVHKAVLASRSAVLKAHFEHNTTECHTNILESPLESEVLTEVLTFIYSTDKAPRVDDIPEKLLAAADFYQLTKLKSLCEEALCNKLTEENAIETLQLAYLYSATFLKQLTLDFIKDAQTELIIKTKAWANMKSVELIKTMYEYIVTDDVEDVVDFVKDVE